jgi:peptidyl-prolyl cis-trans isomerase SurA
MSFNKRNTNIFLTSLLIFVLSIGYLAAQEGVVLDKIAGAVGSEIILLSDIESQLAYIQSQRGRISPDDKCIIIESLLGQNLMLHQARLDSVMVTDEEVEAQINTRMDRILALMNNDFQQFEEYYGKSVSEVRSDFRDPLHNQILTERMQQTIMTNITITPSEVKSFFNRVPKDSLPYFNAEVELAEIIYYPKVNEDEKQIAYAKISKIRKMIVEEGQEFGKVASTYSEDGGSARLGGDLGWQKRGTFVPEFEAIAYNLEPGEISEIFESPFGYHFLELIDRRGSILHTRHVLITPKITELDHLNALDYLDSLITLMNSGDTTATFEMVLKNNGSDNTQSFHNGGRMMNPQTGDTFFEISDLDPGLFFVIDTMSIGNVSAPIAREEPSGKRYYQLIRLMSRSKPHKASLKTDYSRIQEAALQEKKSKFLQSWISEHIGNTYVEIADEYRGCPNLDLWLKNASTIDKP